jgi:hypothetical protein
MSKKGMEMSINIVVGMVLGIAMLGAGILLFAKIADKGNELSSSVDERTKQMIYRALDSGEQIYVPESKVEVERKYANFWIGVRNTYQEEYPFTITVEQKDGPTKVVAFDDDARIAYFKTPYTIEAKGTWPWNVVVDMKGITETIILVITVKKDGETYSTPKIVTIKP